MEQIIKDMLLADGFEKAFIGVGERCGQPDLAVYDRGKCLEILQADQNMSYEEAEEFFEFNVLGAWVGEQTPMFVDREGVDT